MSGIEPEGATSQAARRDPRAVPGAELVTLAATTGSRGWGEVETNVARRPIRWFSA